MEEKKETDTEKLCISTEEEFLQEARRRIPDLLKKNKIPGMAAICVHNGKVIWNESFGLADKKNNIPVSNQTVFELASISKTLTAWGVMKLVEQGIIELDESVCKYMKRWQFPEREYDANKITFRMLLNHIAGLSQNYYFGYKKHHKLPSLEEAISYGGNQKDGVHIIYEPGTKLFYSGGGYLVLQLLIEEITGKEFSTYMKEEILDPLGMKDSTFEWNPEWKNREAKGYGILGGQMGKRFYVEKAAAGLYSTPNDFAKFICANVTGENGEPIGRSVLKPETAALMTTRHFLNLRYSMGYIVIPVSRRKSVYMFRGANPGWFSQFAIFPESNSAIAFMTNSNVGNYLTLNLIQLYIQFLNDSAYNKLGKILENIKRNVVRDLVAEFNFQYMIFENHFKPIDVMNDVPRTHSQQKEETKKLQ